MTTFQSSLAQQIVAAKLADSPVAPQGDYNSRAADKFIVRADRAVLAAVAELAQAHGRSVNAELVAALLDGLCNHSPSQTLLDILKAHLGSKADQVLAGVETFDINLSGKQQFIIRLPDSVRQQIEVTAGLGSMNRWAARMVAVWVNTQRQCDALLSACMLNQVSE